VILELNEVDTENNHTYTDNIDIKNNNGLATENYGTQQLKEEIMGNMNEGLDLASYYSLNQVS